MYDQVLRGKSVYLRCGPRGTGSRRLYSSSSVASGTGVAFTARPPMQPRVGVAVVPPPPTQKRRKLGLEAYEVRLGLGRHSLPCFCATKPRDPRGDTQDKSKSNGRQLPWVVPEVGRAGVRQQSRKPGKQAGGKLFLAKGGRQSHGKRYFYKQWWGGG